MNYLLLADGVEHFCSNTHQILSLIGWALTVFKIAIPLIIIVLGLLDLGKAAVSSKPEEIKKSATSMLWRIVGGIVIFFVPMIITVIFGWISGFSKATSSLGYRTTLQNGSVVVDSSTEDWQVCYKCINSPWNYVCKTAAGKYDTDGD